MRSIRDGAMRAASVTGSLVGKRPDDGGMAFDDGPEEGKIDFYDNDKNMILKTPDPK